jgi:hypothetical protein
VRPALAICCHRRRRFFTCEGPVQLLAVRVTEDEVIVYGPQLEEVARHLLLPRPVTGQRNERPEHRPSADPRRRQAVLRERFAELGPVAVRFLEGLVTALAEQYVGLGIDAEEVPRVTRDLWPHIAANEEVHSDQHLHRTVLPGNVLHAPHARSPTPLVRAKPTACGRATLEGSADPAPLDYADEIAERAVELGAVAEAATRDAGQLRLNRGTAVARFGYKEPPPRTGCSAHRCNLWSWLSSVRILSPQRLTCLTPI